MKKSLILSFGLFCLAAPLLAIDPILVPVGPERRPFQGSPCCHDVIAVDMAEDGSMVTLWNSQVAGVRSSQVLRFDANGEPLGAAIEVPVEARLWGAGRLSGGPGGTFVVLSTFEPQPIPGTLRVTRYSAAGQLGDPIDVANLVGNRASVDHDALGRFVVLWVESENLRAALFDADGNQLGPIIEVSQSQATFDAVTVAFAPSGGFWAFYEKRNFFKADGRMHRRLFDADGQPLGPEIEVLPTDGEDSRAAIAPNGTAASVTRVSHFSLGQLYAADGELGPTFTVWDDPMDVTYVPLVAPLGSDEFLAATMVAVNNGKASAFLTRIDPAGQPVGPYLVLSHPTLDVAAQALISKGSRAVVFVWTQGQLDYFQIYEAPLFADGFESGDFSAWGP